MASGKRDPELMSRVLADAETLGEEAAAKKHGISERTIRRYRKVSESCPEVASGVLEKRRELSKVWLEAAKQARMEALQHGLELCKKSENLHHVTGFLKIVHDAVLADEMLAEPHDDEPGRSDGLEGPQGTGRQMEEGETPTTRH